MRVALRWLATDDIEDNFVADVTLDRSEVAATKILLLNNAQVPNGAQFITGPEEYKTYATYTALNFTDPGDLQRPLRARVRTTPCRFRPNAPIDAYGLSNKLEWKLPHDLSFTSITGYRRYSGAYSTDYDGSPFTIQLVRNTFDHRQFTQELRLSGTAALGGGLHGRRVLLRRAELLGRPQDPEPGPRQREHFRRQRLDRVEEQVGVRALGVARHQPGRASSPACVTRMKRRTTPSRASTRMPPGPSYTRAGVLDGLQPACTTKATRSTIASASSTSGSRT